VRTALSFSDPGIVAHFRDGLAQMLGNGVDLLFCNLAEAQEWTGAQRLEDAARDCASGAILRDHAGWRGRAGLRRPPLPPHRAAPVKPIDTNGAGDMFAGAYIYGITSGFDAVAAGGSRIAPRRNWSRTTARACRQPRIGGCWTSSTAPGMKPELREPHRKCVRRSEFIRTLSG